MYERILVPLDGSDLAETALPYSEELAGTLGSDIRIIHVSEAYDDKSDHMHQLYMDNMIEAIRSGAQKYTEASGRKEVNVGSVQLYGHAAEQIVDYADREKNSLIVMATHGQSGIRRWLLGSVATKVVMAAKQPVMLVRAQEATREVEAKRKLRKVLVPLDGSKESEAIIPHIGELVSKLKAEVVLLQAIAPAHFGDSFAEEAAFVSPTPQQMEKIMTKFNSYLETVGTILRDRGVKTEWGVVFGIPAEAIITTADSVQADLVAMSTHGLSGIGRWTLGSTANKVLHAASTPVLLVRPH